MGKSLNMNYVNCALLVVVLVLVVMCCMNNSKEGFKRGGKRIQAKHAELSVGAWVDGLRHGIKAGTRGNGHLTMRTRWARTV